jgi:hypothetical protein
VASRREVEDSLPAELAGVQVVGYFDGTKDEVADLLRALPTSPDARPLPNPLPPAPALPASRYTRLRDDVRADRLDGDQQQALVRRLREWWQEEGDASRAGLLVDDLAQRPDLLASVVPSVEALRRELTSEDGRGGRAHRRRSGWSSATRAERVGMAIGGLAVLAVVLGQLTADLYADCDGCKILRWGEGATAGPVSRVPYLILGGVLVCGLVAVVSGRARRGGAGAVLAAGILLLITVWIDVERVAGDSSINRFGSGLRWTVLAGLMALAAGAVLLACRSGKTSSGRR